MTGEDVELTGLILAAKSGDHDALDRLLGLCRPDIRNWIDRECRSRRAARVDVSGVTQEALLYISRHMAEFRGSSREELEAWFRKISLHRLIDEVRRNAAQKRGGGHERSLGDAGAYSSELADTAAFNGSTPSVQASRRERLQRALERLPPDERAVVKMHRLEARPPEEVAGELGISVEEVMIRLNRGLRSLQRYLREE